MTQLEASRSTTGTRPALAARPLWVAAVVAIGPLVLMVTAVVLRCIDLDHLPGVNGDEAWSGVQAMRIVRGEPITWRTPTGNLVNPFFLGPLVALHLVLPPSFALLRSVAALSGLAAIGLCYVLCRRLYGQRTAVVAALLYAVLPINIAYSRFAWDASQSLAATTLVLFASLLAVSCESAARRRWLAVGLVGLLAAVVVHPTNIFVAPLWVFSALAGRGAAVRLKLTRCASHWPWRWVLAGAATSGLVVGWFAARSVQAAAVRLVSLGELQRFAIHWVRLLSGDTVYRYISGALPWPGPDASATLEWGLGDGVALIVIGAALYGVRRQWQQRPSAVDAALLGGTAATLFGFYLVAGPEAAGPHFERYSLCLVAPSALVLARGIAWWHLRSGWRMAVAAVAWSGLAATWLLHFQANYFDFLRHTGGESHRTFRTAAIEPKQQLYALLAARAANGPQRLICPEWWIYWPVQYLALGGNAVQVACAHGDLPLSTQPAAAEFPDTCSSQFCGAAAEARILESLAQAGIAWAQIDVVDYAGRPLISVLEWRPKSSGKNEAEPFDIRQSRPRFQVPRRTRE